ncbi:MAG: hypothetical protein Q7J68_07590 [Thermoplasmata archaeon]|nr:hypothetical protein [Thermoplasmata archaeon]
MEWNELRDEINRMFSQKAKKLSLNPTLDLNFIEDTSIIGENVFGEAFPNENRVWLEVVAPDASDKQILKILCHELIHIKHPDWNHDSQLFKKAVSQCMKA